MMKFHSVDLSFALELDGQDELAGFRDEFRIGEENLIYLDGNSLGMMAGKTAAALEKTIRHQWGNRLIRSWNESWINLPQEASAKIAKLVGAGPDEIIVADSTSVNLFKLVSAVLHQSQYKNKVVSDEFNFPSDLYIIQGVFHQLGSRHRLELVHSRNGIDIENVDVEEYLDEDTALTVLSHVAFKSAFMYDMKEITRIVHEAGSYMLWDLSHSVGVADIRLNECNVDLAVGCTYKYLNGGPGAPAFLYVRKDLQEKILSPIWGWFGDSDPFKFRLRYNPSGGINKFLAGTPPVLSLSALNSALDITLAAGIEKIRRKSIAQTNYMLYLIEELLTPTDFEIASPSDPQKRGSHISVRHGEAYRISKAMIDGKAGKIIIPDFREPDIIRLGVNPLYNTFAEINIAVRIIREIVETKLYENYKSDRDQVT